MPIWAVATSGAKVALAADSLYSLYDLVQGAIGDDPSLDKETLRQRAWAQIAATVCKHDLNEQETREALEPALKASKAILGRQPTWMPEINTQTWLMLRQMGGCPVSATSTASSPQGQQSSQVTPQTVAAQRQWISGTALAIAAIAAIAGYLIAKRT